MTKPHRLLITALLVFFLFPTHAHAWGMHYLVTDRALAKVTDGLDTPIRVESLDDFVLAEKTGLAALFDDYYAWLAKRGSKRFKRAALEVTGSGEAAFLRAARLNPKHRYPYVTRLLPGKKPSRETVPFAGNLSRSEKEEKGFTYVFESSSGTEVTPRSVLVTFSDEPDWGMDSDLWQQEEYGYGKIPYGREGGSTDGAAFHCQYTSENFIVRWAAPEVTEGMVIDRLELMARLARLAFRTGHPYWGYRFTAWGMHYIEDVSQPYHTSAVPFGDFWFYAKLVVSLDKDRIKRETQQLVTNRHDLYEDFAKVLLELSYLGEDTRAKGMAASLSEGDVVFADIVAAADVTPLFTLVTQWSSSRAPGLDRGITAAYGDRLTRDPSYDLQADPAYESRKAVQRVAPSTAKLLEERTSENFQVTGRATRTFLAYCRGR